MKVLLSAAAVAAITVGAGPTAVDTVEGPYARWTSDPMVAAGPSAADAEESAVESRVRAAVEAAQSHAPIPARLHPAPSALNRDRIDLGGCRYTRTWTRLCRSGDRHAHRAIVLLGDSHARAWIPAVERIARRSGYAAYYLAKSGCTAARVTPHAGSRPFRSCNDFRRWAIGRIERIRPEIVLLGSAMPPGVVARHGRVVRSPARIAKVLRHGFEDTVRAIRRGSGRIFIAEDTPPLAFEPADCLVGRHADLGDCASPPSRAANLMSAAERAAARATVARYIPTRQWFCADDLCPAVVGSTVTRRDPGHYTTPYSRSLNRVLQEAMGID